MKMYVLHVDICGMMSKWYLEVNLEPQLLRLKEKVMC